VIHATLPLFLGLALGPPVRTVRTPLLIQTVADMIIQESLRVGVPPYLALNLAWRESNLNPLAVSETHDLGVFQLAPHTRKVLHVAHPLDARQGVIAGVGLLSAYRQACGSDSAAIYAFAHGRCPR
jgi:soluble lytic murein transglycosylase-like protein